MCREPRENVSLAGPTCSSHSISAPPQLLTLPLDIGSKSHFVAIGQNSDQVREFNVYSSGQQDLVLFLKDSGITTIAMESTGSYWQSLFRILQVSGFEVLLVSGQQTKNVRAKTDVKDCQWIQKLHSMGLLRGCICQAR